MRTKSMRYVTRAGREYTLTLPAMNELCERCHGDGKHVNPSVDGHGLTALDFDDEDFRQDYMQGRFDVRCEECLGERVVKVVDEERLTKRQRLPWENLQEEEREAAQERAWERRNAALGIQF